MRNSYKSVTINHVFARQILIRRSIKCVTSIAAPFGRFSASCSVSAANVNFGGPASAGPLFFFETCNKSQGEFSNCCLGKKSVLIQGIIMIRNFLSRTKRIAGICERTISQIPAGLPSTGRCVVGGDTSFRHLRRAKSCTNMAPLAPIE